MPLFNKDTDGTVWTTVKVTLPTETRYVDVMAEDIYDAMYYAILAMDDVDEKDIMFMDLVER
jgi:hypothetical protein